MAPQTPDGVPASLVAGDSWRWRIPDSADYPQSEGWALKYELVGASVLQIIPTFQSSGADANHWLVAVPVADTEALLEGSYSLVAHFVGSGTYAGRDESAAPIVIDVLPNPRAAEAGTFQTHAEKVLAIIEAKLENRLSADLESYQIAGRSINKIPFAELRKMRRAYQSEVNAQRSGQLGRTVKSRFTNVGA